jgi:hypothetical protein
MSLISKYITKYKALKYKNKLRGIYVVHSPTNALFIKLGKVLEFTLKHTLISLLHVSVYDHHQGACNAH